MAYAFSYDAPGSPEVYRLVSERIGAERPDGLVVQVVTSTQRGLRHLNVWESREQWEAFRDTRVRRAVASVLEELGLPPATQAPVEHTLDLVDVGVGELVRHSCGRVPTRRGRRGVSSPPRTSVSPWRVCSNASKGR